MSFKSGITSPNFFFSWHVSCYINIHLVRFSSLQGSREEVHLEYVNYVLTDYRYVM